jgi:nucleoside-diphosphate-sugar epimerase
MNIAILGSTSEIAKDIIYLFAKRNNYSLYLFSRNKEFIINWCNLNKITNKIHCESYDNFNSKVNYNVIINFIGAGNPEKVNNISESIIDITYQYNTLVINYLKINPECKYIFLSSGAAYGENFEYPVNSNSKTILQNNKISNNDAYTIAKIHSEIRHRLLGDLGIVNVRIFNYFSRTMSLNSSYLITNILRSLINKTKFITNNINIARDYISAYDLYDLFINIILNNKINISCDIYTKKHVKKLDLLEFLKSSFGLKYEIINTSEELSTNEKIKMNYYSINKDAETYFNYTPKNTSIENLNSEILKLKLNLD